MKWGRIGLFLSGIALGSTVFMARKKRVPLPAPWWIPEKPEPFSIVTDELEWSHENQRYRSHLEYFCQPTQFRLWNLLDLDLYRVRHEQGQAMRGDSIFHVILKVHLRGKDKGVVTLEEERFYATIHTHRGSGTTTLASAVQVGRYVEFRKCHVGGAPNGIETGERVVSMAPVQEIRPGMMNDE
ncbi:MAG: hypothetical protein HYX74_04335 [Acidobacteria bacterium]|nr:hypothetical protein [Acidobacteriota bacterium]